MQNVWPPYDSYAERMKWYYSIYLKRSGWIGRRIAFLAKFPECAFRIPGICTKRAIMAHHTKEGYERLGFERTDTFDHLIPVCAACHHYHHRKERFAKLVSKARKAIRLIWLP